jgi:hypothetical protein
VKAAAAVSTLGAALVWSGTAAAADPPPPPILPGVPAVDQYRENLPTGLGPVAPGATSRRGRPLPPRAQAALRQAAPQVRAELTRVATSPAYGAPPARHARPSLTPPPRPSSASWSSDVPLARVAGLALVLLALTGATAVAARRQRRTA